MRSVYASEVLRVAAFALCVCFPIELWGGALYV
jgi:hypothetical protein